MTVKQFTIFSARFPIFTSTLDRLFYPHHSDHWDDELFRRHILRHITPESTVLDLGAGAGIVQQMHFRGMCKQICGLDPMPVVLDNPHLELARCGSGESIPWPDATFDVVYAYNVLEHLRNPPRVFSEVLRVLKPGGLFLVKTPNRWHYVAMISRLTPLWFHRIVNKQRGRRWHETFKTFYRANSKGKLQRLAKQSGFQFQIDRLEGRPEYMRHPLLYPFGLLWERAVNRFPSLAFLRVLLIASFTKPLV